MQAACRRQGSKSALEAVLQCGCRGGAGALHLPPEMPAQRVGDCTACQSGGTVEVAHLAQASDYKFALRTIQGRVGATRGAWSARHRCPGFRSALKSHLLARCFGAREHIPHIWQFTSVKPAFPSPHPPHTASQSSRLASRTCACRKARNSQQRREREPARPSHAGPRSGPAQPQTGESPTGGALAASQLARGSPRWVLRCAGGGCCCPALQRIVLLQSCPCREAFLLPT